MARRKSVDRPGKPEEYRRFDKCEGKMKQNNNQFALNWARSGGIKTCQDLYDARATWGFCDGKDLADFFYKETGDPSPKGSIAINEERAFFFVESCCKASAWNSNEFLL